VGRIAPAEADVPVGERDQSVIGDGDPVGVVAEVRQHMLRAPEGPFGINDPIVAVALPDQIGEEGVTCS